MSYQTIVAIDLGKFKSVLCVMDVATRTHRFAAIESTPPAIREAVRPLVSREASQTLVVFETCDTCGWVHDQLAPLDDLSAQPLGTDVCEQDQPWIKGKAKAGDCGAGKKGADHFMGHT